MACLTCLAVCLDVCWADLCAAVNCFGYIMLINIKCIMALCMWVLHVPDANGQRMTYRLQRLRSLNADAEPCMLLARDSGIATLCLQLLSHGRQPRPLLHIVAVLPEDTRRYFY